MGINLDKPHLWKNDISQSIGFYNRWFMSFAPKTFKESRRLAAGRVAEAIERTRQLAAITPEILKEHPEVLRILRMCTCPPLASDRLIGLSGAPRTLVSDMEDPENPRMPAKLGQDEISAGLGKLSFVINEMIDQDIFAWVPEKREPCQNELARSSAIVADRLCGSYSGPVIRNEQEKRQLEAISGFLISKGYSHAAENDAFGEMEAGTFSFHMNVPVYVFGQEGKKVNVTVDVAVKKLGAPEGGLPVLIECKSAGDFANVNKRRKEEAEKMHQLKDTYGQDISYVLFLCGYFDAGYLGYEAAEGIDWIWEHRISDLDMLGL